MKNKSPTNVVMCSCLYIICINMSYPTAIVVIPENRFHDLT